MLANVCTSLIAALVAILLNLAAPATAVADERDEAGTYGDPMGENDPEQQWNSDRDRNPDQDRDRDRDTDRDNDRNRDNDRETDWDWETEREKDQERERLREQAREQALQRERDRTRERERARTREQERGRQRTRERERERAKKHERERQNERNRQNQRDQEQGQENDWDWEAEREREQDQERTTSPPPARLRPAFRPRTPDRRDADQPAKPRRARPAAKNRTGISRKRRATKPQAVPRRTARPATRKRRSSVIPPRIKARGRYTRSLRRKIRAHNKKGQPVGNIQLYARENRWGPGVKVQRCYGDNVLSKFTVLQKGDTDKIWFQFRDVTYRNRGRRRHKWINVEPGMLMRGRHILLRAQAARGNGVLTLKVVGHCIE